MELSRQEYWSGLPFLPPGDPPDPGIKPECPALASRFFTAEPREALVKVSSRVHASIIPGGEESACQLRKCKDTQVRSLGREDALEKEMATHSSILAWRVPWTEEPGGLQSTGLQSQTTEQLNNNKEATCCIGFSIREGRLKSQILTKNLPVMQETRV